MKKSIYFLFLLLPLACTKPANNSKNESSNSEQAVSVVSLNDTLQSDENLTPTDSDDFPMLEGKREIHMPVAYIWEYRFTPENPNDERIEYEIWAYYEPKTKSWGLMPDWQFGSSGGMYDYIFGKPNGEYFLQIADEHGVSTLDKYKIDWANEDTLPNYYKPTGKKREFKNVDIITNKAINTKEYRVPYMQMEGHTDYYLADSDIDLTPLYQFGELLRLNMLKETTMPVYFPNELPGNKLLVYSVSESLYDPKGKAEIILTSITHTATYFYLLPEKEAVEYVEEEW